MKRRVALMLAVATLSMGILAGCSAPAEDAAGGQFTDGTYEGAAEGFHGEIKVKVEVADGKISNVEILEQTETAGLGDVATEDIAKKIVEAQSTEVEAVSGATMSSNGTMEAVKNALEGK